MTLFLLQNLRHLLRRALISIDDQLPNPAMFSALLHRALYFGENTCKSLLLALLAVEQMERFLVAGLHLPINYLPGSLLLHTLHYPQKSVLHKTTQRHLSNASLSFFVQDS